MGKGRDKKKQFWPLTQGPQQDLLWYILGYQAEENMTWQRDNMLF